MQYKLAFLEMQAGRRIARPHWTGYWYMEGGEIFIHCGDDREFNLRESDNMIMTMCNICAEDWVVFD